MNLFGFIFVWKRQPGRRIQHFLALPIYSEFWISVLILIIGGNFHLVRHFELETVLLSDAMTLRPLKPFCNLLLWRTILGPTLLQFLIGKWLDREGFIVIDLWRYFVKYRSRTLRIKVHLVLLVLQTLEGRHFHDDRLLFWNFLVLLILLLLFLFLFTLLVNAQLFGHKIVLGGFLLVYLYFFDLDLLFEHLTHLFLLESLQIRLLGLI